MSTFLVLGAGRMADGIVFDLVKNGHSPIYVYDINRDALDAMDKKYGMAVKTRTENLSYIQEDSIPSDVKVIISTLPYDFSVLWSKAAILKHMHFIDLGGNNDIVSQQRTLSTAAHDVDVAIIPDCGLAPGLVSILTQDLLSKSGAFNPKVTGHTWDVQIECGGLPMVRDNPLEYQIVFSPHGLINEYIEPTLVLSDGQIKTVPSLTGVTSTSFPWGFNNLEKFFTSGGASTLPESYAQICRHLEYKTIRYRGHCEKMKLLLKIFGGERRKFEELLAATLPLTGPDVILLKVACQTIDGDERSVQNLSHSIIQYGDKDLTAMAKMTAFPAAIIAQALANDTITKRGTLKQEEIFDDPNYMVEELKKRNISFV